MDHRPDTAASAPHASAGTDAGPGASAGRHRGTGSHRTGNRLHAWARRHPTVMDTLLALLLFIPNISLVWVIAPEGSERPADAWAALLIIAVSVPVAFRRSHPARAVSVTVPAMLAFWVLDYPDPMVSVTALVLVYSAAAFLPREEAYRLGAAAIGGVAATVLIGLIVSEEDLELGNAVATVIVFVAAFLLGDTMRNRRAYLGELERRVEESDQRRIEEARRATVEERTRIAREMHDIVAHNMSVMVVQAAGGRRVVERDPERAAEALRSIEETGREALAEMRTILGVLRDQDRDGGPGDAHAGATRAPQPGLAALATLVSGCEAAGITVELAVERGERPLPPGVDLSAYRIVQEALTNVIRHAGPCTVRVDVRTTADAVEIAVVDDGRGASAAASSGGGHGIDGMRERAELHGGSFAAAPAPGGGFAVRATLPLSPVGGDSGGAPPDSAADATTAAPSDASSRP